MRGKCLRHNWILFNRLYLIGRFAAKKRKTEYVQNFHVINVPIVPMNVDQTRIVPETKNVVTTDVLIHVSKQLKILVPKF